MHPHYEHSSYDSLSLPSLSFCPRRIAFANLHFDARPFTFSPPSPIAHPSALAPLSSRAVGRRLRSRHRFPLGGARRPQIARAAHAARGRVDERKQRREWTTRYLRCTLVIYNHLYWSYVVDNQTFKEQLPFIVNCIGHM